MKTLIASLTAAFIVSSCGGRQNGTIKYDVDLNCSREKVALILAAQNEWNALAKKHGIDHMVLAMRGQINVGTRDLPWIPVLGNRFVTCSSDSILVKGADGLTFDPSKNIVMANIDLAMFGDAIKHEFGHSLGLPDLDCRSDNVMCMYDASRGFTPVDEELFCDAWACTE